MNVLILGASGMLGHQLWLTLSRYHQVTGTVRSVNLKLAALENENRRLFTDLNADNQESVRELLETDNFDIVVNCIGVIKQLDEVKNAVTTVYANSLFPHLVAKWSGKAKVIQVSTDCVFSGKKGGYTESDVPDAYDLYGRSKLLGEIDYVPHLTLRTSIVGHELYNGVSLFDWFLSQSGQVKGYRRAIYSGLTTLELANRIHWIITEFPELTGVWQISSDAIDKYTLLKELADVYNRRIDIVPFDDFSTDKSLSYAKLQKETGYTPLSWRKMIEELHGHYLVYKDQLYTKNRK